MGCSINSLRDKEVINVCDGRRLGYIFDVEINAALGSVVAIVVRQVRGAYNSVGQNTVLRGGRRACQRRPGALRKIRLQKQKEKINLFTNNKCCVYCRRDCIPFSLYNARHSLCPDIQAHNRAHRLYSGARTF